MEKLSKESKETSVDCAGTTFIDLPNGGSVRASAVIGINKGESSHPCIIFYMGWDQLHIPLDTIEERDDWLACIVAQLKAEK